MHKNSYELAKYVSLALLLIAVILLIPLGEKLIGYIVFGAGLLALLFAEKSVKKHFSVIFLGIAILGITPINTDISFGHFMTMGGMLLAAVGLPYVVMRYVYKEPEIIKYTFGKQVWSRRHVGYLLLTLALSYFILPLWMQTTGEFHNWTVVLQASSLAVLFLGTNLLGIWDELFFIVTTLAVFRKHLPFWLANLSQAIMFTGFLYELGFRGWAPLVIFPFALLQGIAFKWTKNLIYIIAIHLTLDLVLYLALINAHHPHVLTIFLF